MDIDRPGQPILAFVQSPPIRPIWHSRVGQSPSDRHTPAWPAFAAFAPPHRDMIGAHAHAHGRVATASGRVPRRRSANREATARIRAGPQLESPRVARRGTGPIEFPSCPRGGDIHSSASNAHGPGCVVAAMPRVGSLDRRATRGRAWRARLREAPERTPLRMTVDFGATWCLVEGRSAWSQKSPESRAMRRFERGWRRIRRNPKGHRLPPIPGWQRVRIRRLRSAIEGHLG
jgi:hypothetical protein